MSASAMREKKIPTPLLPPIQSLIAISERCPLNSSLICVSERRGQGGGGEGGGGAEGEAPPLCEMSEKRF